MSPEDTPPQASRPQGALHDIARMIPGFQGYLKAEDRREADRLQREYLCHRLDAARAETTRLVAAWTDACRFGNVALGGKVGDVLQRVTGKVRHADQAYAGFFASGEVDDVRLAVLYEVDRHMLSYVKQIERACAALDPDVADGEGKQALETVKKAAEELEAAFARRKRTISEVT